MTARVLPNLGGARLSEILRIDLQDLADQLCADGLDASTVRNTLMPLGAIFRRAVARGDVAVNPTTGLELPPVEGGRDRFASPPEAATLLAALPERDRALWATALYAGLRRGELLALRWEDVDLAAGVIRVERSWDAKEGFVAPKSRAGRRTVPIAAVLRDRSYMGHSSVTITYDRYGHLMPGNESEAAGVLDAYLERAVNDARAVPRPAGTHRG